MKKICFLVMLCLSFVQLKAQQGIVFKVKYLPDHNYQVAVNLGMKINATISGDSSLIDKLNTEGITQPVLANVKLVMNGTMKSGPLNADKSFPLNMDYKVSSLSASAEGKQAPIPGNISKKEIRIIAHVNPDGTLQIDSAEGKKAADTTKQKMQQMMNLVQKEIQFPNKPLKPGDTFTQSAPITLPVKEGESAKVDYSTVYKLVSISDGKAYFDMTPTFSLDLTKGNTTVNVTGTGTGKMVYSIKDNFPISKEGTFNMTIKVSSDKLKVDGTAVITSTSDITIN